MRHGLDYRSLITVYWVAVVGLGLVVLGAVVSPTLADLLETSRVTRGAIGILLVFVSLSTIAVGKPKTLLIVFLGLDVGFLLLHVLYGSAASLWMNLSVEHERGYGELFQYGKYLFLIGTFILLSYRNQQWIYLPWMGVFGYFLVDDAFEWHDSLGIMIGQSGLVASVAGIEPRHVGEAVVGFIIGGCLLALIGGLYLFDGAEFRDLCWRIVPLLGVFGLFAVMVDFVHQAFDDYYGTPVATMWAVLEEGGEMSLMSVICWQVQRMVVGEWSIQPSAHVCR